MKIGLRIRTGYQVVAKPLVDALRTYGLEPSCRVLAEPSSLTKRVYGLEPIYRVLTEPLDHLANEPGNGFLL